MVEVKWTDFAIQNLNEIGDYIEKKSYTSYASRVVSGLFAAVDVLERFPLAGRMVPEFQDTTISLSRFFLFLRQKEITLQ